MKATQAFSQLLAIAATLAPLASAWPNFLPEIDALVARQDDSTTSAEPSRTAETSEPTSTEAEETSTRDSESSRTTNAPNPTDGPRTTNLNTGGMSGTRTGSASGNSTSRTQYDPLDGAGSVNMITPATQAGTQLYMIEAPTPITWVWNYTALQDTPSAINVLATISAASATKTWTLTSNMTYEPTATFTWDTRSFQEQEVQNPLLTEQYRLVIHDADSSPDATAEAGYLAPYDSFQFGLYAKQDYKDLNQWQCATCSGARSDLDKRALNFAISMSIITILSFTWYVVGIAGPL
jgi:hypothetical protein